MVRKAAGEGLRLLDFRAAGEGRGTITGGLADLLPPADKCLADSTMVFMPDGYPFEETADGFPNEIKMVARRGLVFVASALDILLANQELLEDPLSPKLDCCRVWVPSSEESREMLRTLGDAALVGGRNNRSVVFNAAATKQDGTPRFRTVAEVAADLAKARAKQKAEPHQALSAPTNSQKMETLDLEAMLVDDPEGERSLKVDGARLLLAKWTEQVGLYDDDNSYTVRWGGVGETVAKDFKDIFRCGYNYPNAPKVNGKRPVLKGATLMRYYIEVLDGAIKDATGEEEED